MENKRNYLPIPTPIGTVTAFSNGAALTGLYMTDGYIRDGDILNPDDPVLQSASAWLSAYFAGERPDPAAIPTALSGTAFQMLVWEELRKIPYGKTVSYGQIAKTVAQMLGKDRMSAQAVGNAVGANPVSIIIPCHRVLGAGMRLTGYAGGLERKIHLLELEGIPYKR